MAGATKFLRTLKFDKSHCTHCGEQFQQLNYHNTKEIDKEEDLRKCYAIVFEYALKCNGINIDFNNSTQSTSQIPTISSSFCRKCQFIFRELYKYYKRFVISAGSSSFVRYVMRDSLIWSKRTVIRVKKDTPSKTSPNKRLQKDPVELTDDVYDDYDENEDYFQPPPVTTVYEDEEDEGIPRNSRSKSKFTGIKKLQVKLRRTDDSDPDYRVNCKNKTSHDDQEPGTSDITRRSLRCRTNSIPNKSYATVDFSSSEQSGEDQPPISEKTKVVRSQKMQQSPVPVEKDKLDRPSVQTKSKLGSKIKYGSREEYLAARRRFYQKYKNQSKYKISSTGRILKLNGSHERRRNSNKGISKSNLHLQKSWVCTICKMKFPFRLAFLDHMKTLHPKQKKLPFKCSFCEETFLLKRLKIKHEEDLHPTELAASASPTFKCDFEGCDILFSNLTIKNKHFAAVHQEPEEKICDTCGRAFKLARSLQQHLRSHEFANNPPDMFKCTVCGKGYKNPYTLRFHMRNYHSEGGKPYLCSVCGTSFMLRHAWKRHMRTIHADGEDKPPTSSTTGKAEFPFKCDVCGKGWRRKDHLLQHLKGKSHGPPFNAIDRQVKSKIPKRKVEQLQGSDPEIHNVVQDSKNNITSASYIQKIETFSDGFHPSIISTNTLDAEAGFSATVLRQTYANQLLLPNMSQGFSCGDTNQSSPVSLIASVSSRSQEIFQSKELPTNTQGNYN